MSCCRSRKTASCLPVEFRISASLPLAVFLAFAELVRVQSCGVNVPLLCCVHLEGLEQAGDTGGVRADLERVVLVVADLQAVACFADLHAPSPCRR